MELVYLWVKNYKNIHKQGFNFSPRFSCDYDEDKNELTIDENKDYIENFFGDNINVTAIVGKNGSGKSSLLKILESGIEFKELNSFLIYKKEEIYYCEYNNTQPKIIFNKEIISIDKNNSLNTKNFFYPNIIRIAHSEKIGKDGLAYYYFGEYSGLYNGRNIERLNFYNMLEARFFVPRYINIVIDHFELFEKLKQMYKFDTLRLLLRNNSTSYLRKWINNEIVIFRDRHQVSGSLGSRKVCIYEKNERTINNIQQSRRVPISEVEIHLYNRDREKIVSILEDIERMHRSQTFENQIDQFNKYQEFDLGVLIAFIEYYLNNTDSCESCELIHQELLMLKEEIKDDGVIHDYFIRIVQSYILSFFERLRDERFKFTKDNLLTIDEIIEAINYLQKFKIDYFDSEGNPYIDIPVDEHLKENIDSIKIMQKIFFEYDFDSGSEEYLRVFEYNLINNQIGSSYETISDGEKHFIRFSIDILYHLQTLKNYNFTPDRESLAIFLADEPDNAMHPIWKKRLIESALEIFNNYSDIPNINLHFIYTTHSPFLLSDIPKQNIIFLDTYIKEDKEVKKGNQKIGNCKVLKHDKVLEKKQTFGANIHTLLSDSFFMKDGLMGEFAKSKINEIIEFHKEVEEENKKEKSDLVPLQTRYESDKKRFWQTQSIIGEDYLKQILENHLIEIEKVLLGTDKAKERKIKRLEAELVRLKDD